jgi:hypothetical protein
MIEVEGIRMAKIEITFDADGFNMHCDGRIVEIIGMLHQALLAMEIKARRKAMEDSEEEE